MEEVHTVQVWCLAYTWAGLAVKFGKSNPLIFPLELHMSEQKIDST